MANSDKNIIITPNIGGTADPKIVFSGADATTAAQNISLNVYPTSAGTLSFEGSAGQLFSITNNLTGTIFSVNDISGIPSIEVDDDGTVRLAEFSGNVLIGTNTDDGTSALQVDGTIAATTINIGGYTAATEAYVTTAISNLVDTAPATLDTLNELAAALGDDANFSTTVTNSIATKWTQDNTKIGQWDTAYGWGNHASAGYTNDQTAAEILTAIKTVDGSGSGLDADTVDGLHAASFVQQGTNAVGNSSFSDAIGAGFRFQRVTGGSNIAYGSHHNLLQIPNTSGDVYLAQMAFGTGDTKLAWRSKATSFGSWYDIWHSGNDGSGSGLDADLLDGQHGSYYAPASSIPSVGNGTLSITTSGSASGSGTFTANQSGNTTINISATDTNTVYTHPAYTARSINTSGAQVLDIFTSDAIGSVTNITTRTMTLAELGYTGATNANYITNNNQLTNGAGYTTNTGTLTAETLSATNTVNVTGLKYFKTAGTMTSPLIGSSPSLQAYQTGGNYAAYMAFHRGGYYAINWGLDTNNAMVLGGWSSSTTVPRMLIGTNGLMSTAGQGNLWGISNDGSGSGLDADLLDGNHASAFLGVSAKAADSNLFDGVDSANFVYGANGYGTTNLGFASMTNQKSGFYDVSSSGTPTATWYSLVNMAHYGANHGHQIAGSFYSSGDIYNRNNSNTTLGAWAKIWNTANDGSGSGLDADLLDGNHASAFMLAGAAPNTHTHSYLPLSGGVLTGNLSITVGNEAPAAANSSATGLLMRGNYNSNTWAHKFHKFDHSGGVPFYLSETVGSGAWAAVQRWGTYTGDSYKSRIFGTLKVDGVITANTGNSDNWNTAYSWGGHSGVYLPISGKAADSELLDGIDSTSFLRSDATDTATHINSPIFSGNISTSGDGQNNYPFRLTSDYNSYMVAAASNTWGLFWAGSSGARYGTNGNGGPGNIWSNSTNPNEFCFVGGDSTAWTVQGSSGDTWQKGTARTADQGILWGASNDGSGSTLDADLLDGLDSSAFARLGGTDHLRSIPNRWFATADADNNIDYYQHNYAKAHLGNTYKYTTSRPNITADSNYWVGSMGWGNIDLNTIMSYGSGFWDSWSSPTNQPSTYTSHWTGFNSMHYSASSTYHHGMQMAMGAGNPAHTYLRGWWANGGTGYAWQKIWTDGNDGSGSTLDADLLDGQQGSYYAPASHVHSYLPLTGGNLSGTLTFSQPVGLGFANGQYIKDNGSGGLVIYSGAAINLNHTSGLTSNGGTVWASNNDGSGSGLDADLLDGLELHTGRNDNANKVVRTEANGYCDFGWINTTSGVATGAPTRIYCSQDAYIRYYTPASLAPYLANVASAAEIYTTQTAGTAGVHYPTFVSVNASGNKSLKYDPGMMYDPSTNILGDVNFKFKGTLTGNVVGNATTASSAPNGSNSNTSYIVTAGVNNGIGFWGGTGSYAIQMGDTQTDHGTVTDYSMHHNMGTTAGRGFTFGSSRTAVTCSINALTGAILSSNNITAYSDIRIKDNIEVIPNALDKVKQLSGYTFTRTDVEDKEKRYTGVIAQEVLKVLPEAVQLGATEEDTMSVAYGNMVGLMIEAIKELKSEVDDLKAKYYK